MKRRKIGFLSSWGDNRGRSMVTKCFIKMITPENDCFILKQFDNDISEDYSKINTKIDKATKFNVSKEEFKNWIQRYDLDAVVFNEHKQWEQFKEENLTEVCKELGVKSYGYLVYEKFDKSQTKDYDRILVPNVSGERIMRINKVRHFTRIPYSIDLKEFKNKEKGNDEKFTFLHVGGMLGAGMRKNTDKVIKAFIKLDNPNTKLIVTSQRKISMENQPDNIKIINKNLTSEELIELYKKADCFVYPSKWDTIGICMLESLSCGTPVLTTNSPPMNEYINNGLNGQLVKSTYAEYPGISIGVSEVDEDSIKNKMHIFLNESLYKIMQKNSRKVIEELYDIEKNRNIFLNFIDGDLK